MLDAIEIRNAAWAISAETADLLRPAEDEYAISTWRHSDTFLLSTMTRRRWDYERPIPIDASNIMDKLAAHHFRCVTPTLVKVGDWFATLSEGQDDGTDKVVAMGQGRTALVAALRMAAALDTQTQGWRSSGRSQRPSYDP